MELLKVEGDEFGAIFLEIKERHLSSTNFPKLIVGTGLSIVMGIPGMEKLSEKLERELSKSKDVGLKKKWDKYSAKIKLEGLEAALLDVSPDEEELIEEIKQITGEFILDEEYKRHKDILSRVSGFEKLIKYLSETVSVNNRLIDIMTPNYDRIIEIICDKLEITATLGFCGEIYQKFEEQILRNPYSYFNKEVSIVRIFKPHGSINWIRNEDGEYQINDYKHLKSQKKDIDIIAPGSRKYKDSMINDVFRCHRETFNKLVDAETNYSLLIYGYGFNDQHFNTVFQKTTKDVLVLTQTINSEFLNRALKNKNWTVFYKRVDSENSVSNRSFMVYKGVKYEVDTDLWDMDIFAKTFLG